MAAAWARLVFVACTRALTELTTRVAVWPWSVSASRAWTTKVKILAGWEKTDWFCLQIVGVRGCWGEDVCEGGGDLLLDQLRQERVCVGCGFFVVGDGEGIDPGGGNVLPVLDLCGVELQNLGDRRRSIFGCEDVVVST